MFRFIKHKLLNKKWLNFCLLIGIALLSGVASCNPMFQKGSLNKLLQKDFTDYAEEENEFPAVISRSGTCEMTDFPDSQAVLQRMKAYEEKWTEYIDVDSVVSQQVIRVTGCSASTSLGGKNKYFDVGMIEDMDSHIQIVDGTGLEDAVTQGNAYPCLISESVMDDYGLVVGEVLSMDYCLDAAGNPASFQIVGVFAEKSSSDNFWYRSLSDYSKIIFTSGEVLDDFAANYQAETYLYDEYLLLDYTQMNSENAEDFLYFINEFQKADSSLTCNFKDILTSYTQDAGTVKTILWVLELPTGVLLLAFVYMVSAQILEMEENEIAMLKSRGVERKQIIGLYTLQSGVLAVLGALIGIFFGYVLCKAAASTNAFLDFSGKDVSVYRFTPAMLFYALAAGMVAVLFMTLPVLALSKRTIVQQKKAAMPGREKSFWEKYFLDVILLLIACYLLYNYNKQTDILALSILSGDSLDPLIFLDASLFIFACGLFLLRILKYFVRLVYFVGRKHWKPAMYASFLQITRSFRKQGFISVFLVLTIAMGIFDSNMARTINQNNEERIRYDQGTDVRVQETWKMRVFRPTETETYRMYTEPDYERYTGLLDENICESMTRVITDENTNVTAKSKTVSNCKLMAIQTKEFGETASLKQGLTEEHWYNYLNTLSQQQDGVIISRNLAERLGLQVGDTITYTRTNSIFTTDDQTLSATGVSVCAIVDAWPGYDQYSYTKNEDGTVTEEENYLLVANYAAVVDTFELTPYSIWMKLSPGKTLQDVTDYLANAEINTESIVGTEEEITAMKDSALIQITNGMFTISFLISVILCSVGFLIYWIMSIRKRELSFGIYRAMGMSMGEINQMLVNEQIFSSLLSGIAGGGVGMLATFLFAKLLAVVYLPEKHNVSIEVLMGGSDMIKLFLVVLAVLVICLLILRNLVKNMKIAQALKLGED